MNDRVVQKPLASATNCGVCGQTPDLRDGVGQTDVQSVWNGSPGPYLLPCGSLCVRQMPYQGGNRRPAPGAGHHSFLRSCCNNRAGDGSSFSAHARPRASRYGARCHCGRSPQQWISFARGSGGKSTGKGEQGPGRLVRTIRRLWGCRWRRRRRECHHRSHTLNRQATYVGHDRHQLRFVTNVGGSTTVLQESIKDRSSVCSGVLTRASENRSTSSRPGTLYLSFQKSGMRPGTVPILRPAFTHGT